MYLIFSDFKFNVKFLECVESVNCEDSDDIFKTFCEIYMLF